MRAITAVSVLYVCALAATGIAQTGAPDFSGRWRLVEPTPAEREAETLVTTAPNELLITDTTLAITIEHPSKPGTHPEAGVFKYAQAASSVACQAAARPSTRGGASRTSARN